MKVSYALEKVSKKKRWGERIRMNIHWNHCLWDVLLHGNRPCLTGHCWLSLQVDVCSLSLGLLLQLGVGLDTADELLSGAGQGDVLDTEVDALLDITVLDLLVDNDTDGALGNVVDDTGLSVVNLVRHTIQGQHFCFARHDHPSQCIPEYPNATHPFWTAPLALMSTISPTLYCLK